MTDGEALEAMRIIERLREGEGNCVQLVNPNHDFNGHPDEVVAVTADWTGWEPKRFAGATLLQVLRDADGFRRAY